MLSKLECDVMSQNELLLAVDLAVRYKLPALVVNQTLVGEASCLRIARRGRFKILTPVDWNKGDNYGMLKLRGMVTSAIGSDGFEILLTPDRTPQETEAEARQLLDFFQKSVRPDAEVRFVLHMLHNEATSLAMHATMLNIRRPSMVRTDIKTKMQTGKSGITIHQIITKKLKAIANVPIKVSGNITSLRAIQDCRDADRIAVNLSQLETIVRDHQRSTRLETP